MKSDYMKHVFSYCRIFPCNLIGLEVRQDNYRYREKKYLKSKDKIKKFLK